MTNEEKAMNLSGICSNCDMTTCHIHWCQRRDKYDGAIEMAKWKDEQYKIKIDELINFIKGHCFESIFRNTLVIEGFNNVDEFIDKFVS